MKKRPGLVAFFGENDVPLYVSESGDLSKRKQDGHGGRTSASIRDQGKEKHIDPKEIKYVLYFPTGHHGEDGDEEDERSAKEQREFLKCFVIDKHQFKYRNDGNNLNGRVRNNRWADRDLGDLLAEISDWKNWEASI